MAPKKEKIQIEVFGPINEVGALPAGRNRADEYVRRLARIIGRRIAREHFERQHPTTARRLVGDIF